MKLNNQCEEYNNRVTEMMETNRNINLLLKSKNDELNTLTIKYEDAVTELNQRDAVCTCVVVYLYLYVVYIFLIMFYVFMIYISVYTQFSLYSSLFVCTST